MRQPLTQIALVHAGRGGKFGDCRRTVLMQDLVQPQRITDAHDRDARGTAEVREHLPHKLMQFGVVYHC
jgi:hypothetical protein